MPSGVIHYRNWKKFRFLAFAGATMVLFLGELWVALAIPPGYYLGALVDPDWDMPWKLTEAKRLWKKIYVFGPIMVTWINLYGRINQRFFGGHRSIMSHLPGWSTLLRLLWLTIPVFLVISIFSWESLTSVLAVPIVQDIILGLFLGLTLSDTVHVLADMKNGT